MTVANEVAKRPSATSNGTPSTTTNGSPRITSESVGQPERDRLRMMMLIRRFEERTFQEYQKPIMLPNGQKEMKIGGFCHLYSGQEAIAVGTSALFDKTRDYMITGYRCHGASLAMGMSPRAAMAEMFGKASGCSKGKGGSMHLFDTKVGNLGGHGIVGGQLPMGLGTAFRPWYKKTGGVTFTFMGDGAINQGTFNEALNMASLMKVPAIYVVENNGVAMGTQVERSSAEPDLAKRAAGFNMPYYHVDGNDVDAVIAGFGKAVERGRAGEGPTFICADTYRFRGHSMSDAMNYRKTKDKQWLPEVEAAKLRDPLYMYESRLKEKKLIDDEQIAQMEQEISEAVAEGVQMADADPHPELNSRFEDALAEKYPYQPK